MLRTEVDGDPLAARQVQMSVTYLPRTERTSDAPIALRDENVTGAEPLLLDAISSWRDETAASRRHGNDGRLFELSGRWNRCRRCGVAVLTVLLAAEAVQSDVDRLTGSGGDVERTRTSVRHDDVVGSSGVNRSGDVNGARPVENDCCTASGRCRVKHCITQ